MTREQFMAELEMLLSNIQAEEREAALEYYESYFADAGPEHESIVIAELGSPGQVAATIRSNLLDNQKEEGAFTETGYQEHHESQSRYEVLRKDINERKAAWSSQPLKWVLIILIAIVAVPTLGGLAVGVLSTLFGLIISLIAIIASLLLAAVALVISGVAIFIFGLTLLVGATPVGLLTSGAGLVIFGLGLAASIGLFRLCRVCIPALARGFIRICQLPIRAIRGGASA